MSTRNLYISRRENAERVSRRGSRRWWGSRLYSIKLQNKRSSFLFFHHHHSNVVPYVRDFRFNVFLMSAKSKRAENEKGSVLTCVFCLFIFNLTFVSFLFFSFFFSLYLYRACYRNSWWS